MEIEYKVYSDESQNQWDHFIEESSLNGTLLHTRKFLKHNEANELDDSSLIFYKGSKIVAVFPAVLYQKDKSLILHSHLRATYGGIIIGREVGVQSSMEIVNSIMQYAIEKGVNEIIVRNPFRIFNKSFADEIDYALWARGFAIKFREIETAIKLSSYDAFFANVDSSTKRNIKKSKQTLRVSISNEFENFWTILEKNLQSKFGTKPTHSIDSILKLIGLVGEEKVKLFAAYKGDVLIGGIVVFIANEQVLHAQYIASDENFQEFRPINAIVDEIVNWGCENGYKYLNLGTSNTNEGREINAGLFRFKEGFGARGVLRETMHIQL